VSPLELLICWVERHPGSGAADTLAAAVRSYLPLPDGGGSREDDYYRDHNISAYPKSGTRSAKAPRREEERDDESL
jgi:hypothetical protein